MKKKSFNISFLALMLLLLSCHQMILPRQLEQDDYHIYSLFLSYFVESMIENETETIVIRQRTSAYDWGGEKERDEAIKAILTALPILKRSTLRDYEQKNSSRHILEPKIASKSKVVIITEEDERSIFGKDSWDAFWETYKGSQGIMTLSKVGFSEDKNQALLYYGNYCGRLCGGGGFVVFNKVDRVWKIQVIFPLWIS